MAVQSKQFCYRIKFEFHLFPTRLIRKIRMIWQAFSELLFTCCAIFIHQNNSPPLSWTCLPVQLVTFLLRKRQNCFFIDTPTNREECRLGYMWLRASQQLHVAPNNEWWNWCLLIFKVAHKFINRCSAISATFLGNQARCEWITMRCIINWL